jgi:hypothetical protein
VDPLDDKIAARLAEIRAQERALDHGSTPRKPDGRPVRSAFFLIGLIAIAAALLGGAVTCTRLAGRDINAAKSLGEATVTGCQEQGPITNRGFGYWSRCTTTIRWDDGRTSRLTADAVFSPDDIGRTIHVGDLGTYHTSKQLARADQDHRPWLTGIGYFLGALALLPTFMAVLFLREIFRFRKR